MDGDLTHIVLTEFWPGVAWALGPMALMALMFWFIMRSLVRADRTERKTYARIEAEEREKRGLPPVPPAERRRTS